MKTNSFTIGMAERLVLRHIAASLLLSKGLARSFVLSTAAALWSQAAFAAQTPPQPGSGTLVLSVPNAANWGLACASGTIYAVGNSYTSWSQIVLGSGNGGNSWSVLDEFVPPGRHVDFFGLFDLGGAITSDSAGNLYVSGLSYPDELSNAEAQWYVRRSTDGGVTWTTVDNFVKAPPDANADDIGLAADPAGNVYACNCDFYLSGSNYQPLWTVRKGIGGTSFSTVDAVPNSRPTDVFVHPTAGIFVSGITRITVKNQTSDAWLVRRSTDGGTTWSNVDVFQLASSKSAVAMGIAANASAIYVVGRGYSVNKGATSDHWIVRKSTNGGSTWTTVDDYQTTVGYSSSARCIATDPSGNVLVAGRGNAGQGDRWVVRKSVGGNGPWTTIDVFQNGSAVTSPNGIASDAFGNVFVGGNDGENWLIKRY